MSKQQKGTEQKTTEKKVMTKYDQKMQKRKEQKEKEKREQRRNTLIGAAVVVLLVCFIASFPIRTQLAVNETYIKINDEKVSRVEFDYKYSVIVNNYISQYSTYLSYMGLDTTQDLSTQMYSDTLSWKDFFEQMTVENMIETEAMLAQAEAEGFTYDPSDEYKMFKKSMESLAEEEGISLKEYVRNLYGEYATMGRIEEYVKENIIVNAYYDYVSDSKAPSDEEILAYYEESPADYDSVDFRMTMVEAQLPTEPTELADEAAAADGTADAETESYEPSEAEKEQAMTVALIEAEAALDTVAEDGEQIVGAGYGDVSYLISSWLFDDNRKAGDTTVITDSTNSQYYVLAFEQRYLSQEPTIDARAIIINEGDGQAILDEWKNGEATEESFAELAKEYSIDSTSADGGLIEGIITENLNEDLAAWLFASERAAGDTTVVTDEESGVAYIMYYVGQNEPEWKLNIKNTLTNETMMTYLEEIKQGWEVNDSKGKLNYLKAEETEGSAGENDAEQSSEAESNAEQSSEAESNAE